MKAILVIDMPKRCGDCICHQCGFCLTNFGTVEMDDKPAVWCPLKPMPMKQKHKKGLCSDFILGFEDGWNSCVDVITGETE